MFYGLSESKAARFRDAMAVVAECYPRLYAADMLVSVGRNMSFYDDAAFMHAFDQAAQNAQERSLVWRLHVLAWAAEHGLHLDGDFVECGVFRGFCTAVLAAYLEFASVGKRWYLYDTFAGVPSDQENEEHLDAAKYKDANLHADVLRRFAAYPNIRVVRGRVPEILGTESPAAIAFMHLDMNSADAELGALEQLFARVVPGGIVVLDDYGWYFNREQRHVEDWFFKRAGYRVLELPTGQGMVLKR